MSKTRDAPVTHWNADLTVVIHLIEEKLACEKQKPKTMRLK